MRGPKPKDPKLRQRTNKASTRSALAAKAPKGARKVPPLRKRERDDPWLPEVVEWWRALWLGPCADGINRDADLQQLYIVVEMVQLFFLRPSLSAGQEILRACQPYGLDPLSRRRLEWTIEPPEESESGKPAAPAKAVKEEADPREGLRVVKGGKR